MSAEFGLVFLGPPRTASRAIGRALMEAGGWVSRGHHRIPTWPELREWFEANGVERRPPDVPVSQSSPPVWNVATVVRNHHDVIASFWRAYGGGKPLTVERIEQWTNRRILYPDRTRLFPHTDYADLALVYEDGVEHAVNTWLTYHGHPPIALDRDDVGEPRHPDWSPDVWLYVARRWAEERARFRYGWADR